MGIDYSALNRFQAKLDALLETAEGAKEIAEYTRHLDASEIKQRGQDYIRNEAGTGKTWQRPWRGRIGSFPGRVESGKMADSFFAGNFGDSITVGWSNTDRYFGYQETGFFNKRAQVDVPGMHVFDKAQQWLDETLTEQIKIMTDEARSVLKRAWSVSNALSGTAAWEPAKRKIFAAAHNGTPFNGQRSLFNK